MQSCIDDLRQWMVHDHLKLNDDEILLIGTTSTPVGNDVIQCDTCIRNLDSWFDSTLSMSTHIFRPAVQLSIICSIFAASVSILVPRIPRP